MPSLIFNRSATSAGIGGLGSVRSFVSTLTLVDEADVTLRELEGLVLLSFGVSLQPDKPRKVRNTMNRQTFFMIFLLQENDHETK